jgi:hypothetical protein
MKNNALNEIIRYVSDNSILIITPTKVLRIYCPFTVKPLVDFQNIDRKKVYSVTNVKIDVNLHTVYIIKGKAYNIKLFLLML